VLTCDPANAVCSKVFSRHDWHCTLKGGEPLGAKRTRVEEEQRKKRENREIKIFPSSPFPLFSSSAVVITNF
jgi:hypothetical protein